MFHEIADYGDKFKTQSPPLKTSGYVTVLQKANFFCYGKYTTQQNFPIKMLLSTENTIYNHTQTIRLT